MWVCGLDWAGPGQGQVADTCECGNEPSSSINCGEFLDWLFKKTLHHGVSKHAMSSGEQLPTWGRGSVFVFRVKQSKNKQSRTA